MPRALITGITGQDGSFLAEQLLQDGWEVFGLVRRSSTTNYWRIQHLLSRVRLMHGDLLDLSSLIRVVQEVEPDHVYNLAAQSSVALSWSNHSIQRSDCIEVCPNARSHPDGSTSSTLLPGQQFWNGLNQSPMQSKKRRFIHGLRMG